MRIELSVAWIIVLNVLGWPVIQLSCAWLGEKLPQHWLNPGNWLFRLRKWEAGGRIYERWCAIKLWKDRLPDGARLFSGGFSKRSLQRRDAAYLDQFQVEACRGELVHWAALFATPVFFLWNPLWASAVMTAYALLANLPCILAQRFNRARLSRILQRRHSSGASSPAAEIS